MKETISGILALAARGRERIPLTAVHSIFHELKSREALLAGLRFSLEGDVCYSRKVDEAIRELVDWGSLEIVGETAVVSEGMRRFRTFLLRSFPGKRLHAVHSASLRFYELLRRHGDRSAGHKDPGGRGPLSAGTAGH